jgi:hypothetical protein
MLLLRFGDQLFNYTVETFYSNSVLCLYVFVFSANLKITFTLFSSTENKMDFVGKTKRFRSFSSTCTIQYGEDNVHSLLFINIALSHYNEVEL